MKNFKSSVLISRFIVGVFIILFTSCQQSNPEATNPPSYPGGSYSEIFESFWKGMNTNYVFWDVDPTDWDVVYTTYKPKFSALGTINTANNALAEKYFTQMTASLIDSHYTITFELTGHQISPAVTRKVNINKQYPDSIYSLPDNFFTSVVRDHYLDETTVVYGVDTVQDDGVKTAFSVLTGRLASDNEILYLHFNSFSFSLAGANTLPALNSFVSALNSSAPKVKAIIVDVRENGGGETGDVTALVGSLTTTAFTYANTHSKNGPNRLDYTPEVPAFIRSVTGAVDFQGPVIALVDHLSISASEITALAIQALPSGKGKIIGTTTWGANGPLLPLVYLNGGQFTVGAANFPAKGYMFVYTSSEALKGKDGRSFEGVGIPPDKWVLETSSALNSKIDLQLQAAVTDIEGN